MLPLKRLRAFPTLMIAVLLLTAAGPSAAHHSFAMFDRDKQLTLEGTVKEFQWSNPHIFIQLLVKNAQGQDEEWSIEGASPNMLFRSGWTNQSFKAGDKVTLVINPLKSGTRGGNFVLGHLPNGTTLGEAGARAPG